MAIAAFSVLLTVETFLLVWALKNKSPQPRLKCIARIAELLIFGLLTIFGVFEWSFRWYLFLTVLVILTIASLFGLLKKTQKPYKRSQNIRRFIGSIFLFAFALLPVLLFPQYSMPAPTGNYTVATAKYTWVDTSRIETLANTHDYRSVTVDFWYPTDASGKVPLVVFSPGAFEPSTANQSSFVDLASHGYVVASISHTYHALYTQTADAKITFVNLGFLKNILTLSTEDGIDQVFADSQSWLDLRVADANFVLDTIRANATISSPTNAATTTLFAIIDLQHIGIFGHSLGGATATQIGRDRSDIAAVINLDGTMIGEEVGVANGNFLLNQTPYPVPLLNVYAQDHYDYAMSVAGSEYANFYASRHAFCAYEIVFQNAGHMNFTDLPLFSPILAKFTGIGGINARSCIEQTNSIVIDFFDCYLKGGPTPDWPSIAFIAE